MDLGGVTEIVKKEAATLQTAEDLRRFWIKYGLLNESSGEFQGYGFIQVEGENLSKSIWNLTLQDIFAGTPMAWQFSHDVEEYCGDRLYNVELRESYALYVLTENDVNLLAMKSHQKGNGRRMLEELERTAYEWRSQRITVMAVRKEAAGFFERLGYKPFRTLDLPEGASTQCYLKQLH